ncbi:carboxyl transferase domain-containing protein [uncultured Methanospirillum sp.]|uniref:carboxyl transferase domain-containing protein n=1 Tax=uncultured Methanospirillum sp. TaxID=262503 RepID=UPI0029C691AF|nr:carboxyl transferase domain-containing protein [uncultured Methanospirillum sp.]
MNSLMRVRLNTVLDEGSFVPLIRSEDTELVGGTGCIDGRKVCIIAINPVASVPLDPFEVLQDELALLEYAEEHHLPVIHLADRPGRVPMSTTAIPLSIMRTYIEPRGVGSVFTKFARLSGVVPRIAVVFSPIATTLTYPVAECDVVLMTKASGMSLARPDMQHLMTGEAASYEAYGGAEMHATVSGTCDILCDTPDDALQAVKRTLHSFPSWYRERPPLCKPRNPDPDARLPSPLTLAYPYSRFDMHDLIKTFIDQDTFLEHRALYASELITGFARVNGMTLGIIANNSLHKGGILFSETCIKLASFASLCNSFNIPLLFLADLPGFMVGKESECSGIIHHGALVFSTLANLSVPKICIIVRKAYTAGLYAMCGTGFEPDRLLAFPDAELTIYGTRAASKLAEESGLTPDEIKAVEKAVKATADPRRHAESGCIDGIIEPDKVRVEVSDLLEHAYSVPLNRTYPRRVLCL